METASNLGIPVAAMSGPYGRQEVPHLPHEDLARYLARSESAARDEDFELNYTESRLRMFAIMVAHPDGEWTASSLTDALGSDDPVPVGAVRDTFYLLMHERKAEPVPFQRALTVRLTPAGHRVLGRAVTRWSAASGPSAGRAGS